MRKHLGHKIPGRRWGGDHLWFIGRQWHCPSLEWDMTLVLAKCQGAFADGCISETAPGQSPAFPRRRQQVKRKPSSAASPQEKPHTRTHASAEHSSLIGSVGCLTSANEASHLIGSVSTHLSSALLRYRTVPRTCIQQNRCPAYIYRLAWQIHEYENTDDIWIFHGIRQHSFCLLLLNKSYCLLSPRAAFHLKAVCVASLFFFSEIIKCFLPNK